MLGIHFSFSISFPVFNGADNYLGANIYILFYGTEQWRIQGVPTPDFEAKTYYLARFCRKLHENERNWAEKGERVPSTPLGSANADSSSAP